MVALTIFTGWVADRNPRVMLGAERMGEALSQATGLAPDLIGIPQPPLGLGWFAELEAARPNLHMLNRAIATVLAAGERPLSAMNRCAAALATLPATPRRRTPMAIAIPLKSH